VLAEGVVRFVGQPIAVVVAETSAQAADAAEAVLVEYDPLEPVIGAAFAEGAPLLFPEPVPTRPTDRPRGLTMTCWKVPKSWCADDSCTSASRQCRWRRTRPPPFRTVKA
jgi:CO/xanthine dehydrogenase Mo-binding subunit